MLGNNYVYPARKKCHKMRKPVGNKLKRCRCSQMVLCVSVSANWNCGLTLFLPRVDTFIAFAVISKVTIENHRCKRRIKKKMNKICQYKCCILRVRSTGKSGFRFSKSKSGFPNRTRNPKTDFTSEKSVLRVDFN